MCLHLAEHGGWGSFAPSHDVCRPGAPACPRLPRLPRLPLRGFPSSGCHQEAETVSATEETEPSRTLPVSGQDPRAGLCWAAVQDPAVLGCGRQAVTLAPGRVRWWVGVLGEPVHVSSGNKTLGSSSTGNSRRLPGPGAGRGCFCAETLVATTLPPAPLPPGLHASPTRVHTCPSTHMCDGWSPVWSASPSPGPAWPRAAASVAFGVLLWLGTWGIAHWWRWLLGTNV